MTKQMGRCVRRTTIFAHDAERLARFYCDVFGFSVYSNQSITLRRGSPVTIGDTDDPRPARFITVRGDQPLVGMIGIISIEGELEDRHTGGRLGIGNVVLVMECGDIDAAHDAFEQAGGTMVMELHDAENTAAEDGSKIPSRRFFGRDPAGYLLEVFEPA